MHPAYTSELVWLRPVETAHFRRRGKRVGYLQQPKNDMIATNAQPMLACGRAFFLLVGLLQRMYLDRGSLNARCFAA